MSAIIMYTDGSTKPNPKPGFSGFGIFGYSYTDVEGKRAYKHPGDANCYFTESGISNEKSNLIAVEHIYEHIEFVRDVSTTNNQVELLAVLRAVELCLPEAISKLTIITDSAYIVNCYTDSLPQWKENNWKRLDNKEIVHLSDWMKLDNLCSQLVNRGVTVTIQWIKGHNNNYGNYLADLYSCVGSNCANLNNTTRIDNEVILSQKINYSDYGKTYEKKDIIYHFKELYFSSSDADDATYCFLYSSSDVESNNGRRNTESIFALNTGYVPEVINKLKQMHRAFAKSFVTTCGIKLSKLNNKDILRLMNYVDPRYMVYEYNGSYCLVRDNTPFVYDVKCNIPLIMNVNNVFSQIEFMNSRILNIDRTGIYTIDITELIVKDKKIAFTNQITGLDITKRIEENTNLRLIFNQTVTLNIGYDIPSYMVLKNIESTISSVLLYISVDSENNVATVYCKLILDNRELLVTNIINKVSVRFL
jgi:ribonuclease HI